jgi:hypothetical protein
MGREFCRDPSTGRWQRRQRFGRDDDALACGQCWLADNAEQRAQKGSQDASAT